MKNLGRGRAPAGWVVSCGLYPPGGGADVEECAVSRAIWHDAGLRAGTTIPLRPHFLFPAPRGSLCCAPCSHSLPFDQGGGSDGLIGRSRQHGAHGDWADSQSYAWTSLMIVKSRAPLGSKGISKKNWKLMICFLKDKCTQYNLFLFKYHLTRLLTFS